MEMNQNIVHRLIQLQCPQFAHLDIRPVARSGHDNRTFHLGNEMIVRLPSGEDYALQIEKENKWLPFLAKHLSLPISTPIFLGKATDFYPYPWSILKYIEGDTVNQQNINSLESFAEELSFFLKELQSIEVNDAPKAGKHNFYRGGHLKIYSQETYAALTQYQNVLPVERLRLLWEQALATPYTSLPVWIHGDVAPGNLLVSHGHLCAVIDFGIMGIGDPACDYAMAWTFFDENSRAIFLKDLSPDMIARARAWALWKALITYDDDNQIISENAHYTIQEILKEDV